MRRRNNVRYKRRTPRPAVRKKQILRKEAQKCAKYPIYTAYHRKTIPRYKRSA